MFYYNGIDVSEGIDVAKGNKSKECIVCCNFFFFLIIGLKFKDFLCNSCHDLKM